MSRNGTVDVACSESLRRKNLGKLMGSVVFILHGVPIIYMGGGGSLLEGGEEVGSQLRVLLYAWQVSKQGPVIPGEACVHTHLSSHVPRGTQQPTGHTLLSVGRF